jgi:putative hydrolase of the HAD superfamily
MDCLLFDYGGTLDSDGETWLSRFSALYKEAGISASPERFARAFYDSDDNLAKRFDLRGLSLEQTIQLQVIEVLRALSPLHLDKAKFITDRFITDCRKHFKRNRPLLERLSLKYHLGIVSNFYGNLESILSSEGLRDLFGAVADSGAVGSEKPGADIFLCALEKLGASAQSALMVGDSIERDMRGAEKLNMRHAWLSGQSAACCDKALRLKTLPELEVLL